MNKLKLVGADVWTSIESAFATSNGRINQKAIYSG